MSSNTQPRTRKLRRAPKEKRLIKSERLPLRHILNLGTILPDEVQTTVTYTTQFILSNLTNYYFAYPFYTNAPYDVDPALGSTATQGHSEMSTLYGMCRVVRYKYVVEFCNTGVFPSTVVVLHRNTNLASAGGSATDFTSYIGNPGVQHALLGANTGPSKAVIKGSRDIQSVIGSESSNLADNYASAINGVPADTTFLEVGTKILSPAGNYLIHGVGVVITLKMITRYYQRKQFTT